MNADQARNYFLSCPEAIEDFPFGNEVHVFKIRKKMFGFLAYREGFARVNLKCDPDEAIMLRRRFESVIPGYHMNKTHWNTLVLDGTVPNDEIEGMIDNSYDLVVDKLSIKEKQSLNLKS
jgi:predicted DNA-binding protein (MmcQ/YjbR family)|tara:strand:+ start:597 stop:956 length:360 start_codon:yes stop_codon:yes gene_type:complete